MSNQPLRYLSLFSGIGGMDLGFDRAGMVCAGQVEIDDYCRRVLARHWPDVPRMNDVREVHGDEFGAVDLICGGFPCQPHSVAGQQRGAADDRNLWPEMRRLVAAIRPAWVVGENVPGIRSTILDEVVSDLEGKDYEVGILDFPACGLQAWHIRARIYIIAYLPHSRRVGLEGAQRQGAHCPARQQEAFGRHLLSDRDGIGRERWAGQPGESGRRQPEDRDWWAAEPGVGRVVHGLPHRMDRIKGLGNAVVPQVAEWLGRHIVAAEMEVNPQ
jgi:DNA (cytosine-5)-methyltransferase 1